MNIDKNMPYSVICPNCNRSYDYDENIITGSSFCYECQSKENKKRIRNLLKDYLFEQNIEIGIND